ncbi:hypothetical protein [Citrobacter freundii]|uniref:hypothetical protein n=1 Tax=Citrobacter freundii TaxID=546 RepID=UPI003DA01203
MKPDVKKIIADIKATKGNRKYCNGLAGTLQDDNYASSICKYVKTVTPERIDPLIEYAEKLEAEVTDTAVQLANAESKCRELAAENVTLNDKMNKLATWPGIEFYSSAWEFCNLDGNDALEFMCDVKTPATDTFLAEVRAQGVEMFAQSLHVSGKGKHLYSEIAEKFAAQLRKGARSLDELFSMLTPANPIKNPYRECVKRISAIQEEYGPNTDAWPTEIQTEYEFLCSERDRHEAEEEDQFQFEAKKRL